MIFGAADAVLQPLGDDQIKAKQSEYATATPYPHVVLRPAIDDATLKSARREAIHELRADYKETDLFKVYQVPHDLGTIERTAPHLADKAPSLLRVRDALYSESTRRLVERITGCGAIGDTVDLFIENMEDKTGQLVVSHKTARTHLAWIRVNDVLATGEIITGYVKCRTKGGLIVDVFGIEAFLPGSQIDAVSYTHLTLPTILLV